MEAQIVTLQNEIAAEKAMNATAASSVASGQRIISSSYGIVASPVAVIASGLPIPIPTSLPAVPQQGSGLSNGAWATLLALVGGGAAVGAFFAGRASRGDPDVLANLNRTASAQTAQIGTLNSQVADLNSQVSTLNSQVTALTATGNGLRADLVTAQNLTNVQLSALETQVRGLQVELTAEQAKTAIAASSLSSEDATAFTAEADAIIAEVAILQAESEAITTRMDEIRDELAALGIATVEVDMIVSALTAPEIPILDSYSDAVKLLIQEFNLKATQLTETKEKINTNIVRMKELTVELDNNNVENVPTTEFLDELQNTAIQELPPVASASIPL